VRPLYSDWIDVVCMYWPENSVNWKHCGLASTPYQRMLLPVAVDHTTEEKEAFACHARDDL